MTTPTNLSATVTPIRFHYDQRDAFVCRMQNLAEGLFSAVDPIDILPTPDDEETAFDTTAFHTRKARTAYLLSAYLCELADILASGEKHLFLLARSVTLDDVIALAVYEERRLRKPEETFAPERHLRLVERALSFKAEHPCVGLSQESFFFNVEALATYFGFAAFDYDDQRRPRSKAPQTEEPVWYPDTDPDWVEVPPDQARRPKCLKKKTRIDFLTGRERKFRSYGQVIRRAGEIAWNVTDPDVKVVAYRLAKKGD